MMSDLQPIRGALLHPFLPAEAPLSDGLFVSQTSGREWTTETVWRRDRGFTVTVREGGLAYVVGGIHSKDFAEEVARIAPRPNPYNTHAQLDLICRDGDDWIVRIRQGELMGEAIGGRKDPFNPDAGRPQKFDFHRLATFGQPSVPPLGLHATDLEFQAVVYVEDHDQDAREKRATGEIRSLWIRDCSDSLFGADASLYFVARKSERDPLLTQRQEPGEPARRIDEDELPVAYPQKAVARTDVSPKPYENFLYVTPPDPEKRAAIREDLVQQAADRARTTMQVGMAPAPENRTIADFIRSGGQWRVPGSPYDAMTEGAPDRRPTSAHVYGHGDRKGGEDFPVFIEYRDDAKGIPHTAHNVDLGDQGWVTVDNKHVGAALIYAKGKAAGDPRFAGEHVPVTSMEAFKASARYLGYGFLSLHLDGLPDEPDFMVVRKKDGYVCDFVDMEPAPTAEACVEALYLRLASLGMMSPPMDLEDRPLPTP